MRCPQMVLEAALVSESLRAGVAAEGGRGPVVRAHVGPQRPTPVIPLLTQHTLVRPAPAGVTDHMVGQLAGFEELFVAVSALVVPFHQVRSSRVHIQLDGRRKLPVANRACSRELLRDPVDFEYVVVFFGISNELFVADPALVSFDAEVVSLLVVSLLLLDFETAGAIGAFERAARDLVVSQVIAVCRFS